MRSIPGTKSVSGSNKCRPCHHQSAAQIKPKAEHSKHCASEISYNDAKSTAEIIYLKSTLSQHRRKEATVPTHP